MERRIGLRQVIYVISLFLIAQLFGLFLTVMMNSPSSAYLASSAASTQNSNPVSFVFWLVINVIIAVLIIMLILRYYRGDLFFKLLEAYIIIFGSFFLFLVLIGDILPSMGVVPQSLMSLALAALLFLVKNRTNKFRNVVTLATSIGAGIFIGISIGLGFGFLALYFLLGIFAVYDYLAVFVLKFMIPFAREAVKRNLAFMIGSSDLEILPRGSARRRVEKEDLSRINNTRVKSLIKKGNVPIVSSVMLGNGDIILPMSLVVGSYVIYANIFLSVMVVVGSTVGLMATMLLLRKYKVGLPAIPPLFAFISIALTMVFLATRQPDSFMVYVFFAASIPSIVAMVVTLDRMKKASKLSS